MDPVSQRPFDAVVYRDVMARFPTGVTVVSARTDQGARLMTANSMTSVSLEPLLVLVCIDLTARFHQAVTDAGEWGVSVLAADQEHLARRFATRGGEHTALAAGHRPGRLTGAPLLDGAVAHLECRTVARHPGGDHTILLGAVLDAVVNRQGIGPLVFYRGRYHRLDA